MTTEYAAVREGVENLYIILKILMRNGSNFPRVEADDSTAGEAAVNSCKGHS